MHYILHKINSLFIGKERNNQNNKIMILCTTLLVNSIIWYDYVLYSELVDIIGDQFYPHLGHNKRLWTLITLTMGFIARPIGALIFGHIGDTYDRRTSLKISLLAIMLPSLIMALLPNYNTIGIMAPITLCFLRLVQGLALGGESGNAVYILENCSQSKRGINTCTEIISAVLGAFFSTVVVNFLRYQLPPEIFATIGWRIAFFIGFVIGVIATLMRKNLKEKARKNKPEVITDNRKRANLSTPIFTIFKKFKKMTLISTGVDLTEVVTIYLFLISIHSNPIFSTEITYKYKIPMLLLMVIATMFFADLSDKIGRKIILITTNILLFVMSYPMLVMLQSSNELSVITAMIMLVLIIASNLGPMNAFIAENLPSRNRFSIFTLSRNLAASLGGMSPLIIELATNNRQLTLYISLTAFISIYCISKLSENYQNNI